ncbi:hypothetical protein [Streptomyces graminilatus]|uniref:hypothetical protein n=1 Tax=Streptomyces graminilatus TaxID=1464070 RepID=UPI0006E13EA5|nr:hypothetical protein [Streptomyces graminilatus]
MSMRIRTSALTALTVAAVAAGTVLTAPAADAAPKAAAPKFLAASELPPHPSSSWTAGPVKEGFPKALGQCVSTEGVMAYEYRYREFTTDLDTSATQLTVTATTPTLAKNLAKQYDDLIRNCAQRIEASSDVWAEGRDYGTLPVEEGAHVRGVHTKTSWGANDVSLLSVGRDGKTVTVVWWGQMGNFKDAPVTAFKKTTTTAVNKLY